MRFSCVFDSFAFQTGFLIERLPLPCDCHVGFACCLILLVMAAVILWVSGERDCDLFNQGWISDLLKTLIGAPSLYIFS